MPAAWWDPPQPDPEEFIRTVPAPPPTASTVPAPPPPPPPWLGGWSTIWLLTAVAGFIAWCAELFP